MRTSGSKDLKSTSSIKCLDGRIILLMEKGTKVEAPQQIASQKTRGNSMIRERPIWREVTLYLSIASVFYGPHEGARSSTRNVIYKYKELHYFTFHH